MTGATGFIGRAVVRRLTLEGWRVRVLVRGARDVFAPPVEQVGGSLEDLASLRVLVRGTHAVVHCAGAVRGLSSSDFELVNVAGLRRLVAALCEQDPPPRLLSLSSLAAREPSLSHYAASKRRGEEELEAAPSSLEWMALRPPAVYGPGDRELAPLFRAMERGLAPVLGSAEARFSLLYVEDLAEAVARWLGRPELRGVFELHDGQPGGYDWVQVADTASQLLGRRVARMGIPAWGLWGLAGANVLAARLTGRAPMLSPGKVRELRHPDWVCDNGALVRALGWAPGVRLAEGLRRTFGWGASAERGAAPASRTPAD